MDQIQRIRIINVVLIKCLIKGWMRDSIGPDGIRSKLLDLPEPAQIFLLRNGTIRGKISGLAKFEIHALDVKDLQPVAGIQIQRLAIGAGKACDLASLREVKIAAVII